MRDVDPNNVKSLSKPITYADVGMQEKSILKDHTGKYSMMRIGFLTTLVIGGSVTVAGVVAAFLGNSEASTLIQSGSLLMGSSGFAKAIQSNAENKK